MKKQMMAVLLSAAMVMGVTGCAGSNSATEATGGTDASGTKTPKIGVLMFDYDGDQGKNVKEYCTQIGETMGIDFEFVKYEAGGSDHLDCVDELITKGVDGIITSFADSGMDVTIKTCEDAGVYLAHYAAVPNDADYETLAQSEYYIGAVADGNADYSEYGKKAAEVVVDAGLQHIGIAGFPKDAKPEMAEIEDGFRSTLAELDPSVEVYDYHDVFFTADNGTDVYLAEHPEMDGFFGMGSGLFFNYPAITEANKTRDQKVTMLACGIFTDESTINDFANGNLILGTCGPVEGIAADVVLMYDKINGNAYDDAPESAPIISTSNLYVTNAEEMNEFLASTCYGTAGKFMISADEVRDMSKTCNSDATYAELTDVMSHLSLEDAAAK